MAADKKTTKKTRRPTAEKRMLQNQKRRQQNRVFKSKVRTALRTFDDLIDKKDNAAAKEQLSSVYSLMDKGVKKGVFKLNKARRNKSRLAARLAAA